MESPYGLSPKKEAKEAISAEFEGYSKLLVVL
jgi:hypothetical protein